MQGKSEENWRVGQRCLSDGDLNAATSRLYYSVLQAVLLWTRERKGFAKTGGGVHGDLCRFVSGEGHQKVVFGRTLQNLRSMREVADYQPDTPDEDRLKALLPTCERMKGYYQLKATPE
ncbi:MAG: hypothetical protein PHG30_06130 [Eubacteriales bacterium]|nr:hypothetical protein [Eubacteriales bacterium]